VLVQCADVSLRWSKLQKPLIKYREAVLNVGDDFSSSRS
jgi:hypothetical protein